MTWHRSPPVFYLLTSSLLGSLNLCSLFELWEFAAPKYSVKGMIYCCRILEQKNACIDSFSDYFLMIKPHYCFYYLHQKAKRREVDFEKQIELAQFGHFFLYHRLGIRPEFYFSNMSWYFCRSRFFVNKLAELRGSCLDSLELMCERWACVVAFQALLRSANNMRCIETAWLLKEHHLSSTWQISVKKCSVSK